MPAQLLFVSVVLLFTFVLLRSRETAHGRAWKRILLLSFVVFVIVTIIFPETSQQLADLLGIGRGTDLVVYFTAFSVMFLGLLVYLKFRRMDQRMAIIVREQALADWRHRLREEGSGDLPAQ